MIGVRREADERILAEPRAQAIDKRHLDAIGVVAGQQTEVASGERRGLVAAQGHRFDRRGKRHARQPLAQHAHEVRRHARRRAEREGHFRGRHAAHAQVALVIEHERQPHRAEPACVEPIGEVAHEPLHAERERFDVVRGRGQVEASAEHRRRHERRARIGRASERAIDAIDDLVAETARERRRAEVRRLARTS